MDLRSKVIEAATESFAMFGYKGTTMDQISRHAGVAKGTSYTFFQSKEDLLEHILNGLLEELKENAESAMGDATTFFEKLERALFGILAYRQRHAVFIKLAQEARELGTTQVVDGFTRIEQSIVDYIAKHIREGQSSGEVASCRPDVIAFAMLKTYTALLTDWSETREPLSSEEIRETFLLAFAKGLSKSDRLETDGDSSK